MNLIPPNSVSPLAFRLIADHAAPAWQRMQTRLAAVQTIDAPARVRRFRSILQFVSTIRFQVLNLVPVFLLVVGTNSGAGARPVSKWEVFEREFRSSRVYENPPQEARLTATFVSPTGRTNRVYGFWNGGSRWAVRFSPDELGYWTFATECSDTRNAGLHQQSGRFLCMVQSLRNNLQQHGRIKVSKGSHTFQHDDGTPFFLAADGVWDGMRQSTRKEWSEYVRMRSEQSFNVALWRAAPGTDRRGKSAFDGGEKIKLNPGFLRSLDGKITRLNASDMVSAIAPLWEIGMSDDDLLPEDQVILLLRQMVGRWDAYHVAWIIAFEADTSGRQAARWRRIGRAAFDRVHHSPVILFCGSAHWALKEFASESWVDAVAFQSGNDVSDGARLWLARGPLSTLWMQPPFRPILNLLPATEAGLAESGDRITSRQATEALARSLFVAPPAGVCYQSRGIAEWDQSLDTNTVPVTGEAMTEWQKCLYLPGATRVGQIRELLEENEFDRLLPASSILQLAASNRQTANPLSALATPRRNRALIFVPENAGASIPPGALQAGLQGTFFSLQTAEKVQSTVLAGEGSTHFTAPGPGEWLLLLAPPDE